MFEMVFTETFLQWFREQEQNVQDAVDEVLVMLRERGNELGAPYSKRLKPLSKKQKVAIFELRPTAQGGAMARVFFTFDVRPRFIVILCAGLKTDGKLYERGQERALKLFTAHVAALKAAEEAAAKSKKEAKK